LYPGETASLKCLPLPEQKKSTDPELLLEKQNLNSQKIK
jgi:hypothetical protein